MLSKSRNRLLLGVILIAVIISGLGIRNELKIKAALEFTSKDVVATWLKDKETSTQNYDYKISAQDLQTISDEISNNKLKLTSLKAAPDEVEEDVTILLDGKKIEGKEETSYIYKTKIYLVKVNHKNTYMRVEIYDINDETMKSVFDKTYTIDSYKLVNTIDSLYN
ncbi:hypothetical protein [Romboutsia sp.]|uniref:hypothetical protein n=1 Tax=Romboutsia sp. TaxID=1965302 RepID=UPI003F3D9BFF